MTPTDSDVARMIDTARVTVPLTVATPLRTKSGAHSRRDGRATRMIGGKAYAQYTV
jgi:hypothetical protein